MVASATPSDVSLDSGGVIATDLTDAQIQSYIDDAYYEASNSITDYDNLDTEDKTQLEKYLASLRIRLYADKGIKSTSRETASVSYEGMTVPELRSAVDARDPSGVLAYQENANRYVGSTA